MTSVREDSVWRIKQPRPQDRLRKVVKAFGYDLNIYNPELNIAFKDPLSNSGACLWVQCDILKVNWARRVLTQI